MLVLLRPRQLFARGNKIKIHLVNMSPGHTTSRLRLLILGAAVTLQLDWLGKIIQGTDILAGIRAGEV